MTTAVPPSALAALTPDAPELPDDHDCGYEFRPGLGYLANDPDCETCCDLATEKWKQAWSRPLPKGEVA